mmetsp:Transcript_11862/g.17177  ORF Transcript_11862/g.17177 Transcript_11862/m.17177 type:complete len:88 (+) Transcript_11862:574-837(+)
MSVVVLNEALGLKMEVLLLLLQGNSLTVIVKGVMGEGTPIVDMEVEDHHHEINAQKSDVSQLPKCKRDISSLLFCTVYDTHGQEMFF